MRSSFADRGLPLNHSYNDEPDTPILRAGLSVMLFTRQKSLSRSRNLFSVLSIGFPFFKRLGGDIDPLELNQPFAGVRSERSGRQSLPLRQSIAFLGNDLADPRLDLVCSRVSVEAFWINDRGCPSASLRQDAFRFQVLCKWLRLRKPRP